MTSERTPLGSLAHDLRGSLGSIRMNLDSALGALHDPAYAATTLLRADDELRRLTACLPAIELLDVPFAAAETHPPDVTTAVGLALALAARAAVTVDAEPAVFPAEDGRPDATATPTATAIAAMITLAAGGMRRTSVVARGGVVTIRRAEAWPMADHLMVALASRVPGTSITPAAVEIPVVT